MSYDISIIKKCPTCDHQETLYSTGDTFNMAPVHKIIFDCELGIKRLNGMIMSQAKEYIRFAIITMLENEEELIKLNPENGWGSYHATKEMLEELFVECDKYSGKDYILQIGW